MSIAVMDRPSTADHLGQSPFTLLDEAKSRLDEARKEKEWADKRFADAERDVREREQALVVDNATSQQLEKET